MASEEFLIFNMPRKAARGYSTVIILFLGLIPTVYHVQARGVWPVPATYRLQGMAQEEIPTKPSSINSLRYASDRPDKMC
jgi:hypothetical protein